MPSLFRFLMILAILAGCVYGAMFALATFVEPNPREMTMRIPADKLDVE
jgi:SNF family Na+-dependent transporter